jgi:branched-chain amino acid transport system permease protein
MNVPVVIQRHSPAHRALQALGVLALLAFFLYVVGVAPNFSALRWAIALTIVVAIQGLNIVTGYTGQISVGHSAFFGIGAYTTMILVADHGWPFLATLPVAGAIGFAVGLVLGVPALRIRGLYLALVTLGLALAFPAIMKSENFFGIDFAALTGGSNGMSITGGDVTSVEGFSWAPPSWAPDGWSVNDWVFTTVFVIAVIFFTLTSNLVRSRVGRGMVAMRDNETGAAVSGVYPAQYKVLAFATSALVTSVGGGCFALAATTIGPDTFGLQRSIEFIAGLVIGGVATIMGPAVGGVLVDWLPHLSLEGEFAFSNSTTFSLPFLPTLEGPEATILYGVLLVLIIFFMPGGIVYGLRVLRSKFLLIVPLLPTPTTARTPEDEESARAAALAEAQEAMSTPTSLLGQESVLTSTPVHQPEGETTNDQ